MKDAFIVAGVRTAVGRASKGTIKNVRPDDLAAIVLNKLITRVPGLESNEVDDVIMGCAIPEAEQGYNIARISLLRAGYPSSVPGFTVNRFCSSGLQAIAIAAEKIMCGFADTTIGGGVESMSQLPMTDIKIVPNPYLADHYPEVYMNMGQTAEEVAARFGISREEQDMFAVDSHQKAIAAIKEGKFKDEIVPIKFQEKLLNEMGQLEEREILFDIDEGPRAETNLASLAKLKPIFKAGGSVTAGNSSQTSDGAAAMMVMSADRVRQIGIKPIGILRSFAVAGVDPDIMGIGPVAAIPKALKTAGLTLDEIDLIELNEAFASQSIYCIKKLELDPLKVNVNGGAIALGHPLGCSGAKLTIQLLSEMRRRKVRYGIVSMCIGGGMGAAAVFESIND